MDRRRERVAGAPGTLWTGKDVHITRGADIERRKKFTADYAVPGTFGLYALRSQLYVFGSGDLASAMPAGVRYQRLQAPDAQAMSAVLDVKTFNGKIYVAAEYADGSIFHFYDAARVTDWDVVAASGATFETVVQAIARKLESDDTVDVSTYGQTITLQARTAGVGFDISASADFPATVTKTVVQANRAAVAEVRASVTITVTGGTPSPGVNRIASVEIDDVNILAAPVDWTGSDSTTAIRLAAAINNGFSTYGYSAAADGAAVVVSAAPGTGASKNGLTVIVTPEGNATVTAGGQLAGGVAAVAAAKQIVTLEYGGVFDSETLSVGPAFEVLLNAGTYRATGLASGTGRSLYVAQQRIRSPVGSVWRYSMLNRGDIWDSANPVSDNDAGFLNVASETDGNEDLIVAARYQGQSAIFSQNSVTIYALDVDPSHDTFSDYLENTGALAPGSVVRYGNNDVFYLDQTGIRSLRARDASNAPFVSDIGNAIDTFVQEYVNSLPKERLRKAVAAIEPRDGRFWLAAGDRIFVLSYFPGAKISAWTYYEPTEFGGEDVQAIVRAGSRLHVRAGDNIYTYGGLDGSTYPEDGEVTGLVELPFLAGKTVATLKAINGFDIAASNVWACSVVLNPNRPDAEVNIGNIDKITFADEDSVRLPGETSMFALVLSCDRAGPATISQLAVHYDQEYDS